MNDPTTHCAISAELHDRLANNVYHIVITHVERSIEHVTVIKPSVSHLDVDANILILLIACLIK